jgi:hypothetical protein
VRPDKHRVADRDRVPRSAPYQSVFHDHDIVADPDFAILRRQDRAMQYAGPLAKRDRAAQHSRGCDVRGPWDRGSLSPMSKNHGQGAYTSRRAQADNPSLREVG